MRLQSVALLFIINPCMLVFCNTDSYIKVHYLCLIAPVMTHRHHFIWLMELAVIVTVQNCNVVVPPIPISKWRPELEEDLL
ncbi:hypothetical protein N665_0002s0094 [Sinapis alba]|nr:hypothetical protein N665_0002s0094 [Sinapis alba]